MKRFACIMLCVIGLSGAATHSFAGKDEGLKERKERVYQLILARFTEGLGLDEAKAVQLDVILRKYKKQKHQLRHDLRQTKAQLTQMTESGKDPKDLQPVLTQFQQTRDRLERIDEAMFAEVKEILTVEQQARFVLIMDDIRHEIRAVRHRHRRMRDTPPNMPGIQPGTDALTTFQDKSGQ